MRVREAKGKSKRLTSKIFSNPSSWMGSSLKLTTAWRRTSLLTTHVNIKGLIYWKEIYRTITQHQWIERLAHLDGRGKAASKSRLCVRTPKTTKSILGGIIGGIRSEIRTNLWTTYNSTYGTYFWGDLNAANKQKIRVIRLILLSNKHMNSTHIWCCWRFDQLWIVSVEICWLM